MYGRTIKYDQQSKLDEELFLIDDDANDTIISLQIVVTDIDCGYAGTSNIVRSALLQKSGGNLESEFKTFNSKNKKEKDQFLIELKKVKTDLIKVKNLNKEISNLKRKPIELKKEIANLKKALVAYGTKDEIYESIKSKRDSLIKEEESIDRTRLKEAKVELEELELKIDEVYLSKFIKDGGFLYNSTREFSDQLYCVDNLEKINNLEKVINSIDNIKILNNANNAKLFYDFLINQGWVDLTNSIESINDLGEDMDNIIV